MECIRLQALDPDACRPQPPEQTPQARQSRVAQNRIPGQPQPLESRTELREFPGHQCRARGEEGMGLGDHREGLGGRDPCRPKQTEQIPVPLGGALAPGGGEPASSTLEKGGTVEPTKVEPACSGPRGAPQKVQPVGGRPWKGDPQELVVGAPADELRMLLPPQPPPRPEEGIGRVRPEGGEVGDVGRQLQTGLGHDRGLYPNGPGASPAPGEDPGGFLRTASPGPG